MDFPAVGLILCDSCASLRQYRFCGGAVVRCVLWWRLSLAELLAHGRFWRMSTLTEIENATEQLPAEQKQELMLFLAARLRTAGAKLPEARQFSRQQMAAWIAEDEADLLQFRNGA